MPNDPFEAGADNTSQDFNSSGIDNTKDYFAELVGEDKKFKSPQDLARAKAESDRFIAQLQSEMSGLRDELKTRTTMEDFLKTMKESRQAEPPANNQPRMEDDNSGTSFKPEDIERLVAQTLDQRTQAQKEAENYRQVVDQVNKVYGNDASQVIQRKANDLGIDVKQLQAMAKSQPKAFLKLVDADRVPESQGNFFSPPESTSQVADTRQDNNQGTRTMAYYDKMRQQDPNKYWTPAIQNQLHKDAMRLGEKFFT